MAKINAGILGGFSGTLGEIKGYRRDGKSIIQVRDKVHNSPINNTLHLRTTMFNDLFHLLASKNAGGAANLILSNQAIYPIKKTFCNEFVNKITANTFDFQKGKVLIGSYSVGEDLIKYGINAARTTLSSQWNLTGKNSALTFPCRALQLLWNITNNSIAIGSAGNRNISSGYNMNITNNNPNKLYFFQVYPYQVTPFYRVIDTTGIFIWN